MSGAAAVPLSLEDQVRQFVKSKVASEKLEIFKVVLKSTKYRLPGGFMENEFVNQDTIIDRIRSDWVENEHEIKMLCQDLIHHIKCKSIRSMLTGVYCYFDIENGMRISHEEYERRYYLFVKSKRERYLEQIKEYKFEQKRRRLTGEGSEREGGGGEEEESEGGTSKL